MLHNHTRLHQLVEALCSGNEGPPPTLQVAADKKNMRHNYVQTANVERSTEISVPSRYGAWLLLKAASSKSVFSCGYFFFFFAGLKGNHGENPNFWGRLSKTSCPPTSSPC